MAKPRRAQPRPSKSKLTKPAPRPVPEAPLTAPPRRTTYIEAVAIYERGVEALQHHDYASASELLQRVLKQYPEEKELHERVRLYLNVCARQMARREVAPRTIEERLYAATLAVNGGDYDGALAHLRAIREDDPDNDHALYMLGVVHVARGELDEAMSHVARAIALNPENRGLARHDPDLEVLRRDETFRRLLETPVGPRTDRRRPLRSRAGR